MTINKHGLHFSPCLRGSERFRVVVMAVAVPVVDDGRAKEIPEIFEIPGDGVAGYPQFFDQSPHGYGLPGTAQQTEDAVKVRGLPAQATMHPG